MAGPPPPHPSRELRGMGQGQLKSSRVSAMIRSHLDSSPRHTERTNVASTATSERQFAGKAAREAQDVGFALSRRQHQEVCNAGAAFQDEQEPGGGEAGRAFKRSERPQRGNA